MNYSGLEVVWDIYCPTWQPVKYSRWRTLLMRYTFLPKKWFKPEPKQRAYYYLKGQNKIVCSPENYEFFKKLVEDVG